MTTNDRLSLLWLAWMRADEAFSRELRSLYGGSAGDMRYAPGLWAPQVEEVHGAFRAAQHAFDVAGGRAWLRGLLAPTPADDAKGAC
jgi:hypothetical protein